MQLSLSTTFDRNATLRAAAAGKYDHIRLFYAADIPVMDDVTGAGEQKQNALAGFLDFKSPA